ncbi:phosphotransferase [Streptomyces ovatisporus]|uniref:Phosphotransferase n=1 Tax=Streptomyces ovatisporus TaxID=1128682 RepID=A0ABV8ZZQ5_9ACTN
MTWAPCRAGTAETAAGTGQDGKEATLRDRIVAPPCGAVRTARLPLQGALVSRHTIHLEPHRVTKRFRGPVGRAAARREWRALKLLAEHAPGLAPAPLAGPGAPGRPEITMSRLPGEPLRGQTVDEEQLTALADAVRALHAAVPPAVLARVPVRPGRPAARIPQAAGPRLALPALVRRTGRGTEPSRNRRASGRAAGRSPRVKPPRRFWAGCHTPWGQEEA